MPGKRWFTNELKRVAAKQKEEYVTVKNRVNFLTRPKCNRTSVLDKVRYDIYLKQERKINKYIILEEQMNYFGNLFGKEENNNKCEYDYLANQLYATDHDDDGS